MMGSLLFPLWIAFALTLPDGRSLPVSVRSPAKEVRHLILFLSAPPKGLWSELPEGTLGILFHPDTSQDYAWLVPWPDPRGGGQTLPFWEKTLRPFLDSLRLAHRDVPVILYGEGIAALTALYLGWIAPDRIQMVVARKPALTAGQGLIFSLVKEAPGNGPSRIVLERLHGRYALVQRLVRELQARGYVMGKQLWVIEPGEGWTRWIP
jgi:pimeloyl-ACP methyl ester carboxylesterase